MAHGVLCISILQPDHCIFHCIVFYQEAMLLEENILLENILLTQHAMEYATIIFCLICSESGCKRICPTFNEIRSIQRYSKVLDIFMGAVFWLHKNTEL